MGAGTIGRGHSRKGRPPRRVIKRGRHADAPTNASLSIAPGVTFNPGGVPRIYCRRRRARPGLRAQPARPRARCRSSRRTGGTTDDGAAISPRIYAALAASAARESLVSPSAGLTGESRSSHSPDHSCRTPQARGASGESVARDEQRVKCRFVIESLSGGSVSSGYLSSEGHRGSRSASWDPSSPRAGASSPAFLRRSCQCRPASIRCQTIAAVAPSSLARIVAPRSVDTSAAMCGLAALVARLRNGRSLTRRILPG